MSGEKVTTAPDWPKTEPDAATLIRFFLGRGQFLVGFTFGMGLFDINDKLASSRYLSAVHQMQSAHDVVLLLREAGDKADDLAKRIWLMADAGDCYGEMFWEWAASSDLDAEAIYEAGHEAGHAAAKADQS